MTKKMMLISGVLALVLVVGLNVRHALNDYGVKDGNLHAEVVAQGTTTSSSTTTGPSQRVTATYTAEMTLCQSWGVPYALCTPFDPCK